METKYFKIAGDLDEKQTNYFQPAGDLEEQGENFINNSETDIKNYLLEIVSGESLYTESEELKIIGGGSMIISFKELEKMVEEDCYNFIKAEYLNPEMIVVEYEKYEKTNNITK